MSLFLSTKKQKLIVFYGRSHGERMKQGKDLRPVFQVPSCNFPDDEGMTKDFHIEEQLSQIWVAPSEMVDPYGRIDQNHC
jgi:hypothetical protein